MMIYDRTMGNFGRILASGEMLKNGRERMCHRVGSSFYAVVYVVEGQGWFHSRPTGGREITAGDAFILYPHISHRYGPRPGEYWRELYLTFAGSCFSALFNTPDFLPPERAVLRLQPIERWAYRLREFFRQGAMGMPRQRLLTASQLVTCLIEMDAAQAAFAQPEWLTTAVAHLAALPTVRADLHRLAADLGLSYDRFRKQFRELTGESPGHFHTAHLMHRAHEMLYSGQYTVKEIAHQLGFNDAFHFSRRFKEWSGYSPSSFLRTKS